MNRPLSESAPTTLHLLPALWLSLAVVAAFSAHAQVQGQAAPVPTVVVKAAQSGASFALEGVVQPVRQATVSAQAAGRIAMYLVKAGDKVKAGQLLATIDDREAAVGVQRSRAQTDQADAELRNAQAQVERVRDLQAKGFVSKSALDTADAQYRSALAQRAQAGAASQQSGLVQGFTRVTAPLDGWVLQTDAQAGDLAVPGKPLLVIYAPQPLRVVVQVPVSRMAELGLAAGVQIQTAANQWTAPTSQSFLRTSDPVSQTTEWRLDLPADQGAGLLPGQQLPVKFNAGSSAAVRTLLTVPTQAIVRRGELTAVYVQSGASFSLRAVRLGRSVGALGTEGTEVLAGLKAGDVVALEPLRAAQARPVNP